MYRIKIGHYLDRRAPVDDADADTGPHAAPLILVTGATGYVGGRLVEGLLLRGFRVRVMVRDVELARERVGEGLVVTFASGLLYDFDSDAIRADAGVNLPNLAESLNKYPDTQLLIVGHTDSVGTTEYNQDLSTRRATAASRYLSAQGVGASRIRPSGVGETEAVASNDTEAGRRTNRRIEVAIFASQATPTAP